MSQELVDHTSLTPEKKVGQLFFIGLPSEELDAESEEILERVSPGGVCLFARNTKDARRTRDLLDSVRAALPFEPFLSLDQEGGLVDRLRRILTPMPSAREVSAAGNPEYVRKLAEMTAESIRILGFNMNFAPVVDVITPERESFKNGLRSRAFGSDEASATDLTSVYLQSLQTGGCLGCVKHFPGLGAAEADAHDELPLVSLTGDELFDCDLKPYRKHFGDRSVAAVMIAHAAYPNLEHQEYDPEQRPIPSSLSASVINGLLRQELGYNGLVLTDDLEMGAVRRNYGIPQACRMALNAGSDFLLICNSLEAVRESYNFILAKVVDGEISESVLNTALEHIFAARRRLSAPLEFDESRLKEISAEIAQLKNII